MANLETAWAHREDVVYPALFGKVMRGVFALPVDLFSAWSVEPDPRWLHHGVFECAPTPARASWLYVTSGTSNPWDDESADCAAGARLSRAFHRHRFTGAGNGARMAFPARNLDMCRNIKTLYNFEPPALAPPKDRATENAKLALSSARRFHRP